MTLISAQIENAGVETMSDFFILLCYLFSCSSSQRGASQNKSAGEKKHDSLYDMFSTLTQHLSHITCSSAFAFGQNHLSWGFFMYGILSFIRHFLKEAWQATATGWTRGCPWLCYLHSNKTNPVSQFSHLLSTKYCLHLASTSLAVHWIRCVFWSHLLNVFQILLFNYQNTIWHTGHKYTTAVMLEW